ncbi:GNAT family N-acetyltransferase [Vibrio nigripulchritudo]|uniref:GNAT family N-acetyltransferase n=1 Tax=Vibrio nigripulchritudo TaxID=28173 RepID=UPI00249265D8|nr:GNAT family protein [Vibrio nigripulchritudo]BDU40981.1 ribosomal-protein-L7/L12-serine acetyltransferase [Vibrio nigripulchritudo]BDU46721.1 ribosomal-protein-L7/L12-serine acetyltransferase [Vibrio nigripulchritudo]
MFTKEIDKDIQLALVQPSFAANYLRLRNENLEYLSKWLAWPPHCDSEEDFLNFVRSSLKSYAEGESLSCAILFQGELVGNASVFNIDNNLSKAKLGYWIAESAQGNGIVTRVCQTLIDIAFDDYQLEKVQLHAAEENKPSRAVAERLGMKLEGIIRRNENLNGRIVDHAIYGLLKSER